MANSLLSFYFFFELSLLPISVIILGWGYQPERLPAAFALLLYTIASSLPLLLLVLATGKALPSSIVARTGGLPQARAISRGFALILIGAFLVKLPIFGVHIWLPLAHVEAPVFASMILAALLLKLGGYGLLRLASAIPLQSARLILIAGALAGGVRISMVCVSQGDLKIVIAYSSVAHMAFVAAAALSQRAFAFQAATVIIVAHGISSSAIFAGANLIYLTNHTRMVTLFSSGLALVPSFTIL